MQHSMPNIKELMENGVRFQIPCYQRHYSWSEDDCAVLLDDIKALAKEHSTSNEVPHFMGCIVVQKDQTGTVWQIIDGQQRLVTMYLFYLALAQAAKDKKRRDEERAVADEIRLKILGDKPKFIFPKPNKKSEYKNNNQDTYNDTDAFAAIFLGKIFPNYNKDEDKALSKHRMICNYRWFYNQLTKPSTNPNSKFKFEISDLTELFNATQFLELVEISLEDKDKPQFVFGSLNAKGEPLEEWDKIRNLVLMEVPSTDLDRCYQQYWLPIERCAKSDSVFVYFYRAAIDAVSMDDEHRYIKFRKYVYNWSDNKECLLETMLDYAETYESINNLQYLLCLSDKQKTASSSIKFKIEQMLQFRNITNNNWWQWIPFGMQCIMMHRNGKISAKELLDVLKLVDTYLVRSFICYFKQKQTGTWYFDSDWDWHLEAVFLSLCDKFKSLEPGNDFITTVKNYLCNVDHWEGAVAKDWIDLSKADELSLSMPNNSVFSEKLAKCPLYEVTPASYRPALMYIIARLEMTYDKEKTDISKIVVKSSGDDRTTIEHIMPQTLNKVWKDDLGGGEKAYEIHETWLDRLANLTLLSQSDNSRVSNKSFEAKCPYYEDSGLSLNQEIASHVSWRTRQFNQRTDLLVDLALNTWPYPKL